MHRSYTARLCDSQLLHLSFSFFFLFNSLPFHRKLIGFIDLPTGASNSYHERPNTAGVSEMDGLSAAASGMAVVSLAIQLVGSVRDVQRFLRSVAGAPKELRRVIDLLEQLELILENIEAVMEGQQTQSEGQHRGLSEAIFRAVRSCECKLKMVESVIEAAEKSAAASSKTARSLGSFKLACKKSDIKELEAQIHDAVTLLNLAMKMNLT